MKFYIIILINILTKNQEKAQSMEISEFDKIISLFLNQFAQKSLFLDKFINSLSNSGILRGGVIMALNWWCWTRYDGKIDVIAIKVIFGATLAPFFTKFIQNYMPYRLRPLHNPDLGFLTIIEKNVLEEWTSFPSDTAVFFFALSTGVWLYSRKCGMFAFVWSAIVVCMPRIYLGLHYVTDIIGGAAFGFAIMIFVFLIPLPPRVKEIFDDLQQRHAKLFYAVMFLVTFELAYVFEDVRPLLGALRYIWASL